MRRRKERKRKEEYSAHDASFAQLANYLNGTLANQPGRQYIYGLLLGTNSLRILCADRRPPACIAGHPLFQAVIYATPAIAFHTLGIFPLRSSSASCSSCSSHQQTQHLIRDTNTCRANHPSPNKIYPLRNHPRHVRVTHTPSSRSETTIKCQMLSVAPFPWASRCLLGSCTATLSAVPFLVHLLLTTGLSRSC